MSDVSNKNYCFLNGDGRWHGFSRSGLELLDDGSLQLCSLPLLTGTLPNEVKTAPVPSGPAGIAIDSGGTVYFSDPDNDRVRRILVCGSVTVATPCMGGTAGP